MVFGSKIIVEANLFNSEHVDGAGSFDYIQCEPGAKPQILKHNVRDLVRKLQVDDPYTFGLLKCKGFVAETVPAGYAELLSLTLVFREPPGPRSLREILLNTPTSTSTTRRLEITRDLASSVGCMHTFCFVHKNVLPESVLIFDRAHGGDMAGFLVGFENFRRDERLDSEARRQCTRQKSAQASISTRFQSSRGLRDAPLYIQFGRMLVGNWSLG